MILNPIHSLQSFACRSLNPRCDQIHKVFVECLEVGVRRRNPLASKIIVGGELLSQLLVLHRPLDVSLDQVMHQVGYLSGEPRLPGEYDCEHQLVSPKIEPPVDPVDNWQKGK